MAATQFRHPDPGGGPWSTSRRSSPPPSATTATIPPRIATTATARAIHRPGPDELPAFGRAVSPGVGFGSYGDDHVRFGLIENEHRTRQAVRGIRDMFRRDLNQARASGG